MANARFLDDKFSESVSAIYFFSYDQRYGSSVAISRRILESRSLVQIGLAKNSQRK